MQAFGVVTAADFLDPVQRMLFKLEVWDGGAWIDLSSYLKSVSVSLGGAGMTTAPIAGTWSATIDNPRGIFHPKHPTSARSGLLRIGREVRISVGAIFGGVPYYWQRIIGFMDAPRFDHGSHEVHLSGQDYAELLTDFFLRDANVIAESASGSGSAAVDAVINGPLHWGAVAVFDSVATGGAGSEMYDEGDACEIGAGEADNVTQWTCPTSGIVSSEGPAPESNYLLRLEREGDWMVTGDTEYCEDTNVASLTAGQQYIVTFWGRTVYNSSDSGGYGRLQVRQGSSSIGQSVFSGSGGYHQIVFTAASTGALILRLYGSGKYSMAGDYFEIDEISVKTYDPDTWMRYDLPVSCNGPYFVTLDGEPVGQGDQDEAIGWHYDEGARSLYLSEQMLVPNGTDNLRVYYYTDQVLEEVLADILVWAGLYADRASALADMNYIPTGIVIERVWFDPNMTAMAAIAKVCERVDYRFWFDYAGKPCFLPAPAADSVDFVFPSWGDLKSLSEFQDKSMIRNRVTIEGAERAMYQVGRTDKANDRWKAEASDAVSIAAYTEKTFPVRNDLFQDQASTSAMVVSILASFKDPKWYGNLGFFANAVPLEIGDVIEFPVQLEPPDPGASGSGSSGPSEVMLIGIIRDIKISDLDVEYKVEIVDELTSLSASVSGSVSASGTGPEIPSGTPSGGAEQTESIDGDEATEGDWIVPTGVYFIEIDGWGHGGAGGPSGEDLSNIGGGGGGGGAFSHVALAVTPGESLHYIMGDTAPYNEVPTEVWRDWGGPGATCILRADYGLYSADNAYGEGGLAANCVGDVKYSGGHGANSTTTAGGGGGSSAGTAAAGNNATTRSGAVAPTGGGNGGSGGFADASGQAGSVPGGGGGGSGYNQGSGPEVGNGAAGKLTFRWWV